MLDWCNNVVVENIRTGDEWQRDLAKRVGSAVADRRKELGMTAQQLAQRCGEIGLPIHRTTITKIENGRPRFDLGELMVLADALNTAPLVLLYPGPYGDSADLRVEVLPGQKVAPQVAAAWFSGRLRGVLREEYSRHTASLLAAMRREGAHGLREIREQVSQLSEMIDRAIDNGVGGDGRA
ncbi:helix-turn-helix transcriptional regulator [Mycobacterium gordonae]|uniref:helix-turn-helix domain-containing protein n=1 Tax=Mycobacterium gordonae TaxID=1778 RepID=UPI0027E26D21|nr:helix-turn-helix transcriptional regulator [Mycobacterium gordonae]